MTQINEAIDLAVHSHREQTDKQGLPYILHPMQVLARVQEQYPTNDALHIAAILHDVVEDTDLFLSHIGKLFGPDIEKLVNALTRREQEGESYANYIVRLSRSDPRAAIIKLADLDHNTSKYRIAILRGSQIRRYENAKAFLRNEIDESTYRGRVNAEKYGDVPLKG